MNLILLSSKSLQRYLVENLDRGWEFPVFLVRDGKFSLDGRAASLDIESRPKSFVANVEKESMDRLIVFLSLIEDQPLTLGFDNGRWIFIKEAIL